MTLESLFTNVVYKMSSVVNAHLLNRLDKFKDRSENARKSPTLDKRVTYKGIYSQSELPWVQSRVKA